MTSQVKGRTKKDYMGKTCICNLKDIVCCYHDDRLKESPSQNKIIKMKIRELKRLGY